MNAHLSMAGMAVFSASLIFPGAPRALPPFRPSLGAMGIVVRAVSLGLAQGMRVRLGLFFMRITRALQKVLKALTQIIQRAGTTKPIQVLGVFAKSHIRVSQLRGRKV